MTPTQAAAHKENDGWQADALKGIEQRLGSGDVPVWVRDVCTIMPDWGFEIHCKRWVEGLDAVLYSLRDGCCYRTPFGRYGDNPATTLNAIEGLASSVESWIEGRSPGTELERSIHETLGRASPPKKQAALCFVDVTRAYVAEQGPTDAFIAVGEKWRKQAASNELLGLVFSGEGLDRGLCDGGGYWTEERLRTVLRLIGGKQTDVQDLLGSCNYQLRHVFRDDRERMVITRGYLTGISTYLNGGSISDIRRDFPRLAGYAIKAYTCLSRSRLNERDKRTAARKLYITARYWYVRALIFALQEEVSEEDRLLPEIAP